MCQSTLHICTLQMFGFQGIISTFFCQSELQLRISAALCFTSRLFVSQRYNLQLLAPNSESFLSVLKRLSFQVSVLSTKFSTVFQKTTKQSSYFLKILYYSWDHSIRIILRYQMYWGEFYLLIATDNSSKENLFQKGKKYCFTEDWQLILLNSVFELWNENTIKYSNIFCFYGRICHLVDLSH